MPSPVKTTIFARFLHNHKKERNLKNTIMIEVLKTMPENVAGFRGTGEITEDDYKNVMIPEVNAMAKRTDKINFLFLVDTELGNITAGAWLQDALLGLKHLSKWNRGAIVTDHVTATKFTDAFSLVVPGEFKGFKKSEYEKAVNWVSERIE